MRLRKPVYRTAHTTCSRMVSWWQPYPDMPKEAMRSNSAAWATRRRPNAPVIHQGSGGSSGGEYSGSVGSGGEGTAILDRQGHRYSTRLLGAPHLDDIQRPVHQVWLRSPSFRGLTEADMWLRLAEGLLPAYDQPQPSEAATDQHAATPADVLALAGVRAWAEYEADTDADEAVICPPTRTLLTILEVRENEEFADTMRLAVALTSPVAPLRAIRLRTIVIYLTESEFDPSELLIHPLSQTIREAGELGGNTGHNQIQRAALGMRKKARNTAPTSLALRVTGHPIYTLTMQLTAHHHSIIATAPTATAAMPGVHADDEEELELNYEENDSAMEVDTTKAGPATQPANLAGKGKAATTTKLKKKQPRGRSRSDGATRNRTKSKPRLSGTRDSDSEWVTNDDATHPSSSSHQ
eukprot:jgi/Tetstr1/460888/TSEL_006045.t1